MPTCGQGEPGTKQNIWYATAELTNSMVKCSIILTLDVDNVRCYKVLLLKFLLLHSFFRYLSCTSIVQNTGLVRGSIDLSEQSFIFEKWPGFLCYISVTWALKFSPARKVSKKLTPLKGEKRHSAFIHKAGAQSPVSAFKRVWSREVALNWPTNCQRIDPFVIKLGEFRVFAQEEGRNDGDLKGVYKTTTLSCSGLKSWQNNPTWPFATSYLCEEGFSAVTAISLSEALLTLVWKPWEEELQRQKERAVLTWETWSHLL